MMYLFKYVYANKIQVKLLLLLFFQDKSALVCHEML